MLANAAARIQAWSVATRPAIPRCRAGLHASFSPKFIANPSDLHIYSRCMCCLLIVAPWNRAPVCAPACDHLVVGGRRALKHFVRHNYNAKCNPSRAKLQERAGNDQHRCHDSDTRAREPVAAIGHAGTPNAAHRAQRAKRQQYVPQDARLRWHMGHSHSERNWPSHGIEERKHSTARPDRLIRLRSTRKENPHGGVLPSMSHATSGRACGWSRTVSAGFRAPAAVTNWHKSESSVRWPSPALLIGLCTTC